ncbi:MAG TPA: citrate lyase subunit beta [Clostridiales bacterium]|nr:MAG: hypothetical protein A2Y22_07035 [Clostridiales bacterium GWD2_32_59]HAN09452.1 citrate lyase subunit beta [Clostridiales bacterium]
MKHFRNLDKKTIINTFEYLPQPFNKFTQKDVLANALGATMYTQGINKDIAQKLINQDFHGLTSNVLCLEDSIGDDDVAEAQINIFNQLELLETSIKSGIMHVDDLPLLFIRVRSLGQLKIFLRKADKLGLICGFNIPKFSTSNGYEYLDAIQKANDKFNQRFYAMPILETSEIIYNETRISELAKMKSIIDDYKNLILNIRVGGTDFSSLYGIRRGIDFSIYDIFVISHCLSDIVNVFGRSTENYTISGPVWEYFPDSNRMLKPQLRVTPFIKKGINGPEERIDIISKEIDGLIKEIILDKANGFTGKTIIHPSHITYVNALQVITYEEYHDALRIVENQDKGAIKSFSGNKMNEVKPHYNWAVKVLKKAEVYGVLKADVDYVQLF